MGYKEKLENLKNILVEMENVAVAYSGGVDSNFLLKVASDVLKENVIAVICHSDSFPVKEFEKAVNEVNKLKVKYSVIETDELNDENYLSNPPDRCYHCKKEILSEMIKFAKDNGFSFVIEGSNFDDDKDYRPGAKALAEMNVRSPLKEAGLTKDEIRLLSKEMNLLTWNKPSGPCLATRFPYGTRITVDKLKKIDLAEQYIHDLGIKQVRVRYHDDLARIEVLQEDMGLILQEGNSEKIADKFKSLGFKYVALDIFGYRMGNLNEGL